MSRYTIEFEEKFDRTLNEIASKKGITFADVFRNAVVSYAYVNRVLIEAEIECEPNLPWKLSITEDDENGKSRVVKDVYLP